MKIMIIVMIVLSAIIGSCTFIQKQNRVSDSNNKNGSSSSVVSENKKSDSWFEYFFSNKKEKHNLRISELKNKISGSLKDPNSAQFRNTSFKEAKDALCGDINAKNSMGGYVGFRPFVVSENVSVIYNGGDCSKLGNSDLVFACLREVTNYVRAARNYECKTQEDINTNLLDRAP